MERSCSISDLKQTARMVMTYGQSGAISLSKHVDVTHIALHVYSIVLHAFPASFASQSARLKCRPTSLRNAFLNSVSLHMRESFSKRRGGGHRSSPFVVSFAPKRLLQSAKLYLDDLFLKRAIPLGECECTGALYLLFHGIK